MKSCRYSLGPACSHSTEGPWCCFRSPASVSRGSCVQAAWQLREAPLYLRAGAQPPGGSYGVRWRTVPCAFSVVLYEPSPWGRSLCQPWASGREPRSGPATGKETGTTCGDNAPQLPPPIANWVLLPIWSLAVAAWLSTLPPGHLCPLHHLHISLQPRDCDLCHQAA